MSRRTNDLPPLQGPRHLIRELRYHEASRQILAFVWIALFAFASQPTRTLVLIGAAPILIGTALRLYASGFIMKNKQLATSGPYALVRHPLYTGNILIIIGFSICSNLLWTAAIAGVFFWFYYPTAIEYEDRKLHSLFAEEWEQWSANVPALVPTFSNFGALSSGEWSFMKSAKQNGEPFIVLFTLACFSFVAWQLP